MKTLHCPNCNAEIKEDFNFCPICTTPINKEMKSTHQQDEEENPINIEDII